MFFAKANNKRGAIYLYEEIGDGWFGGITAQSFADSLKSLGNIDALDIYINSPGGAVFDGIAIFNQIKRFGGEKKAHIDGIAASIASIIPLACDQVNIAPNGMYMIHDPWTMAIGTSADLRKAADSMDKVRDILLDTYVAKTKGDRKKIDEQMADETWMTAEEAVSQGFCDRMTEDEAVKAKDMTFTMLAKFRKAPQNLRQQSHSVAAMLAKVDKAVLQLRGGPARTA